VNSRPASEPRWLGTLQAIIEAILPRTLHGRVVATDGIEGSRDGPQDRIVRGLKRHHRAKRRNSGGCLANFAQFVWEASFLIHKTHQNKRALLLKGQGPR
jgi:hypothetical protein